VSSVSSFLKFFRGSPPTDPLAPVDPKQDRIPRRSSGMGEFTRAIQGQEHLRILDLGPTSAANITYFTGLGHRYHNEDVLLASTDPSLILGGGVNEAARFDVDHFLGDNLTFEKEIFDAVLMWDMPDYLPEALVKPVVERLHRTMKPGGALLGFFHTKDAGPDAPYFRYHVDAAVKARDGLLLQSVWKPGEGKQKKPMFRLQRVFANRHIENLFRDYSSLKFFLARDNVREVLVIR
jgi:SAM-dependent methyltransferase